MLMRPAITLSDAPECGMEVHTHTEDCFRWETGPAPFVCTLDYHEHGDGCFDAEGNLLCPLEEHVHTESCYGEPEEYQVLTCEIPEHTHSEVCYSLPDPTPDYTLGPVLDCGMAEHIHGEGCYDGEDLICTIPEHTHTDRCTTAPTEKTEPAWDSLTEEEKRQELLSMLRIEEAEAEAAFDTLLETYEKTLDEIHTILLDHTPEKAGEAAIETLEDLQAYLEAVEPAENTEPVEATEETETTEPTEATDPTESTEPADPAEVTVEETLFPEEQAALEQIQAQLQIESNEDRQALSELLKTYSIQPSEVLEYLKLMQEDPQTEQVQTLEALKALIEAAMGVRTLEEIPADGYFHQDPQGGYTARVVQDDCIITANVYTNDPNRPETDYHLEVIYENDAGTANAAHGMVVDYRAFTLEVVGNSSDTQPFRTANAYYRIEKKDGSAFEEEVVFYNDVLENVSSNAFTEDKKSIKGTFTSNATTNYEIEPAEISIAKSWNYSNAHFLDWPGASYSIAYILRNYNIFLSGDYSGTHVVGAFTVDSISQTSGLGGLSVGEKYGAPHKVPDYLGNITCSLSSGIITAAPDIPVYLGPTCKEKTVTHWVDASSTPADNQNYWFVDNYINFMDAMQAIREEMGAITATSTAQPDTSDNGKYALALDAGEVYEIPAATFTGKKKLYLRNETEETDTIIIIRGETVELPTIVDETGTEMGNKAESGKSTGIVFLCPDATTVNGYEVTGHLVAPNADVNYSGGNYNGCVIAHNMVTTAEGHMWPYKGSRLVPAKTPVQATKYMNGEPLEENSEYQFQFAIYQQTRMEAEDGTYTYTYSDTPAATGTNEGPNITFGFIEFSEAGEFVYKMVEQIDQTHPGIIFDPRTYYAKIGVVSSGSRFQATIFYYKDEACTEPLDEGLTCPVFNNRYGEKLPDTGGQGTAIFVLPGIALLSLAVLAAILQWKRRAA